MDYHVKAVILAWYHQPSCTDQFGGQCFKLDTKLPWDADSALWLNKGIGYS